MPSVNYFFRPKVLIVAGHARAKRARDEAEQTVGVGAVLEARRRQLSLAEGLIAEEVEELWEAWMRPVDEVLSDDELLNTVYEVLAKRSPLSRTRGRRGTPAEVVLRMLLLKHIRGWSYAVLEREGRANLVYRQFTRVGAGKVPDAKTLGRIARALGPEIIARLHERVVAIAQEHKVVRGRRLRVDTTVVETDIHYPTDSSLLGDGVRVLTRTMKAITEIAGAVGTKLMFAPHSRSERSETSSSLAATCRRAHVQHFRRPASAGRMRPVPPR